MARKTNKQKAQELVAEVARLRSEAKTPEELKAWAENALTKMDEEALKLDSKNAGAWFLRGLAKNDLGDQQGAIDDYSEAIKLNPTDANLWVNRAIEKDELGDRQGAIEDFTEAIKLNPTDAKLWNSRGFAKNASGDHQSAIDDFTKAIELNPKFDRAWSNRGLAKKQLGNHHGAIDDWTKAIEFNPTNALAWNYRGATKNELGDHQGAIIDCSEAIRLDPQIANAWNNRGFAKNALGDHQGALDDFTEGLKLDPEEAPAWNNRGIAKNALGNYQDAIDDYTKAIEIKPQTASTWLNRGIAKRNFGKYDDAIKDFDKAQKLEPNNIHIRQVVLEIENAEFRQTNEAIKSIYRTQMNDELEALKKSLSQYRRARKWLLVALFLVIILYFTWALGILSCGGNLSCISSAPSKIPNSDWLSTISRFSTISFIVVPIIWGIRLLNAGINRAEILKWDLFSRDNVDNSIEYYRRDLRDKRIDIIVAYMNNWINKNPADRLTDLQRKKSANKKQPENETLLKKIKNLLEQLTKSNTKGD